MLGDLGLASGRIFLQDKRLPFMIHEITREKLSELKELLMQLTNDQLAAPIEVLHGSTVGMHMRHILEFYQCLFESLQDRNLNYDLRQRDREMEISTEHCLTRIAWLLGELDGSREDLPLELSADYSLKQEGKQLCLPTTYYRELLYNVEHCVHHLAIIKIGLTALAPSLRLNDKLGVAASTLRNKNLCAQ